MTFGEALECLKKRGNPSREAWGESGAFLELIDASAYEIPADETSTRHDNKRSWIGVLTPDASFSPWSPSHEDLLADDWENC